MSGDQGFADLPCDRDRIRQGSWTTSPDQASQITVATELHDDVGILGVEGIDADDVGVGQANRRAGIDLEPIHQLGAAEIGPEHLDCDLDVQVRIVRQVHVPVSASSDFPENLVVVEILRNRVPICTQLRLMAFPPGRCSHH